MLLHTRCARRLIRPLSTGPGGRRHPSKGRRARAAFLGLGLCGVSQAEAPIPFLAPMDIRINLESWKLPPPGMRMGMLGLNLQRRWANGARFGLEGWGSLQGDKGGFIATGLSGGWGFDLAGPLRLEADLFMGGGGVGRASVGGGLMTRGSLGFTALIGSGRYGLDWSRVRFPNGSIDSRQLTFTAAFPFQVAALAPSRGSVDLGGVGEWLGLHPLTFLITAQRYQPAASVHSLAGVPDRDFVDLVGETAQLDLGHGLFASLDLAAAARGKADGYMEAFLGFGWKVALGATGRVRAVVTVEGGSAGGGDLDVGGGAAFKALAGLEADAMDLRFGLHAGWMSAPGGSLKGRLLLVQAGKTFQVFGLGGTRESAGTAAEASNWSFQADWRRLSAPQRRNGAPPLPVELTVFRATHEVGDIAYVVGEGGFAMTGKAGGFATGLLGMGLQSRRLGSTGPRLKAEALAGAAGGGGVDTRGGLLLQPMLGLEQPLGRFLSLDLMVGRCVAPRGALRTSLAQAGLAFHFGVPVQSPSSRVD